MSDEDQQYEVTMKAVDPDARENREALCAVIGKPFLLLTVETFKDPDDFTVGLTTGNGMTSDGAAGLAELALETLTEQAYLQGEADGSRP